MKYWFPVLLWMLIIFSASADSQSGSHGSRIIEPVLRWFKPDISQDAIGAITVLIRKASHVAEYAILGILLYRARVRGVSRNWCRSAVLFAFALATAYAATDEFHQNFVPNREGQLTDVLIDAFGAGIGLACIWLWLHFRKATAQNPDCLT